MDTVTASLYMIPRDRLWEKEKPYLVKFDPPDGFPKTNVTMSKRDCISIADIRGQEHTFSVQQNGFGLMALATDMDPNAFDDEATVCERFLPIAAEALKQYLDASRVQIFDFLVRKSHEEFPVATGVPYTHQQPSTILHIDTTPSSTTKQLRALNPGTWEELSKKRYQYVNIWKPLKGPVRKWPLCVCDNATVDTKNDLQARDLVFSHDSVESYQVHPSEQHKFYYLSNQLPDEAWVLLQSDSRGQTGTPHTSFHNPQAVSADPERESIEIRALVYYDETV